MSTELNYKRTLVTSALPYANGYIHLGHVAGAYLPADMFTRFLRAAGEDVLHVSGSDEYGVAIAISAETEKVSPREIVDKYHTANEEAFRALGIDFDIYGRTTWPEHTENARRFFLDLFEKGHLVEKETGQFYDPEAQMFLPDRFVEGTCPVCGHEGARGDQCDNCSSTYDQTELKNPISKVSGKPPEVRTTKHLYFKLGDFQQRMEGYVASHTREALTAGGGFDALPERVRSLVWRDHVVQQSRSWLNQGLGDRSITRDLTWGIDVPVPGYEGKKIYVWFDAPIGYITNTKVHAARQGDPESWKKWWCDPESRYVAFIGKDNIVFHTLIFPSILLGHNEVGQEQYIIPENVPANEFLNLEGKKFSKSRNWGIDLRDYLASYPPDPLRYTVAANLPENKDADFTWREYQSRTNNELADILGNFINRTLQFLSKNFDGVVPPLISTNEKESEVKALLGEDFARLERAGATDAEILGELEPKYLKYFTRNDLTILLELARAPRRIGSLYRTYRFREATLETMNVARAANKYFNDSEPWKTSKSMPERCRTTLNICVQVVRSLAVLFEPIIPFTSARIFELLNLPAGAGADRSWWSASSLVIPTGHECGRPTILIAKVEDETVELEVAKLGAPAAGSAPAKEPIQVELKPEVTIDDVMKLDLRVATILSAERVKKSEKLVKLRIRVGSLQRQIVAGIGKQYAPEELVGKRIVVVANLKPAKLMGEESQGMLLAANSPENAPTLISILGDADGVEDGFIVR